MWITKFARGVECTTGKFNMLLWLFPIPGRLRFCTPGPDGNVSLTEHATPESHRRWHVYLQVTESAHGSKVNKPCHSDWLPAFKPYPV